MALILHGSTRVTLDIDILYRRTRENIRKLVAAVAPFGPKLRPARDAEPFRVLSLDALLRIKTRLFRLKDQLALPEIEALIEIRDLERGEP